MKLEEMANLFDGLAAFLDRFGTKATLADLQAVSACFRAFPAESVSSFCAFVVKAKEGKPPKKSAATIDRTKVNENVARIRAFLDHRGNYDDARIDPLLRPLATLKVPEIKAVGEGIGCPVSAKTKAAMISSIRNWLSDILLSDHQSSFNLQGAASS